MRAMERYETLRTDNRFIVLVQIMLEMFIFLVEVTGGPVCAALWVLLVPIVPLLSS